MTSRALAPVLCLALAVTTACADSPKTSNRSDHQQTARARSTSPPLSISWIPGWLKEPIDRAIADANDPHERKKAR